MTFQMTLKELQAGRPAHVQIAFNGQWERSTRVLLSNRSSLRFAQVFNQRTGRLPKSGSKDVALEVFFGERGRTLLGFRHNDALKPSPRAFVATLTKIAKHSTSLGSFLDQLNELNWQAFQSAPVRAELGILDQWRLEPTLELWRAPNPKLVPNSLDFSNKEVLLENNINHVMLELTFSGLLEHWVGLIVSRNQRHTYRLHEDYLDQALEKLGFTHEKSTDDQAAKPS